MVDASVPGPSTGAPDATLYSAAEDSPGNLGGGSGLPLVALAWRCNSWPGVRRGGRRRAASVMRGGRPSVLEIAPADEISRWWAGGRKPKGPDDSYLVDSASSHMLVSKIKPCMSKYKQLYRETANGSLYKLSFI
jgi:hypothetical protein